MNVVGFVPVRSGSKRAPGKNTALLAGEPSYLYAVGALTRADSVSRIIVSSDDPQVLKTVGSPNLEVRERAPHLAGDRVSVLDVVRHECKEWGDFDAVVVVYATSALVRPKTIDEMVALCEYQGWRYPVLATRPYDQPFYQALRPVPGGLAEAVFPEIASRRTQDAPEVMVDAGGVYVLPLRFLKSNRDFYADRVLPYPANLVEFLDVDSPEQVQELRRRVESRLLGSRPSEAGRLVGPGLAPDQ